MKKIKLFSLCLFALSLFFFSCKSDTAVTTPLVEDGFYIMGTATGATTLSSAGMMQSGLNENAANVQTAGLYEKYVALEAGSTFTIVKKAGTVETTLGKDIVKDSTTSGLDYNISGAKVQFGTYKENGTAFSVTKSQLYQVVIYEATKSVAIIPVKWQTNGLGTPDSLGLVGSFNKTTMTYKLTNVVTDLGNMKIKSYNGWKFDMTPNEVIPANKVKVNCNFGATKTGALADLFKFDGTANNVLQGGPDIAVAFANRGKYTVELTWTLGKGNSHTLKFTKTAELPIVDPSTFVYSMIGSAFNLPAGGPDANWTFDNDLVYNAGLSSVTDQTTKAGTYVFKASNVSMLAGGEFKIRKDHLWDVAFGYTAANIKGDAANFVDNTGNIKVVAAATYSTVVFKVVWPANTWDITFTK